MNTSNSLRGSKQLSLVESLQAHLKDIETENKRLTRQLEQVSKRELETITNYEQQV